MRRGIVRSGSARSLEAGVRRRAEFYYQQFDALAIVAPGSAARTVGGEPKTPRVEIATARFRSIGPIRAALLSRSSRHRIVSAASDSYGRTAGSGITTHSSAEHRYVEGELQRAKKPISIRGLNCNHNHDLKNLFKSAATVAAAKPGPFQEFYDALVAKGIKPEMARLTLARKIAAITLTVWKKGVRFDAKYLKPQTA